MGIFDFVSKIFGNKYDKDLKEINPVINQIKEIYPTIEKLSNDELREKTSQFKLQITDSIQKIQESIKLLKDKAESKKTTSEEKEKIFSEIDSKEKEITKIIEETLESILPEAFSVIKETAKRFSKGDIIVSANDFDINLAAKYDNIIIQGDKATYKNKWVAAGTEIEWNMIHYDVQLIGGYVLHKGKIAEMQTGEGKTLSATLPV